METVFRIKEIEIKNFKNVKSGLISFDKLSNKNKGVLKSEIIGIYGQNGSGKTTLSDSCYFLKSLFEGISLQNDSYNFINSFSDIANIRLKLSILSQKECLVEYSVTIRKDEETKKVVVCKEKLTYSTGNNKNKTIINYDENFEKETILPKKVYNSILKVNENNEVNLKFAKKCSVEKQTSFIFNEETIKILNSSLKNTEYLSIINGLQYYGRCNLFVINNKKSAMAISNLLLPLSFRIEEEKGVTSGDVGIAIEGQSFVAKESYDIIIKVIEQMNIVLTTLIPTLKLELYKYGEQILKDGNEYIKAEILSLKEGLRIPLKYESDGIKKIVMILSALISVYNNPSICMIVDEMDSGIFEFLLGEILRVIEQSGKGQLIFTSHNLRALEIIDKDSLYFTTTNSENRYIHLSNVKTNNNLRSLYIKSISLGGQKECLYNDTEASEMRRAFRLAGEKLDAIK